MLLRSSSILVDVRLPVSLQQQQSTQVLQPVGIAILRAFSALTGPKKDASRRVVAYGSYYAMLLTCLLADLTLQAMTGNCWTLDDCTQHERCCARNMLQSWQRLCTVGDVSLICCMSACLPAT